MMNPTLGPGFAMAFWIVRECILNREILRILFPADFLGNSMLQKKPFISTYIGRKTPSRILDKQKNVNIRLLQVVIQ